MESYFALATSQFPVLLLTGARQVGKTSFLRHISGNDRGCVTLDDPLILELTKNDLALFMQRFPPPVQIDEIQYAPDVVVHTLSDRTNSLESQCSSDRLLVTCIYDNSSVNLIPFRLRVPDHAPEFYVVIFGTGLYCICQLFLQG